jgi:exopolyphosphatase / guanosine-5'-triphosphate,3'-diphosphate pyrophosphatase
VIANIARYHRKGAPATHHPEFMRLNEREQEQVRRLAALLRLADALDREHRQNVRAVRARVTDSQLQLELEGEGDLLLERWALQQKAGMFEKVYGLDVKVSD